MRPYAFVLAVPDLGRSVRYFVEVLRIDTHPRRN
jgi:hypothetical protein